MTSVWGTSICQSYRDNCSLWAAGPSPGYKYCHRPHMFLLPSSPSNHTFFLRSSCLLGNLIIASVRLDVVDGQPTSFSRSQERNYSFYLVAKEILEFSKKILLHFRRCISGVVDIKEVTGEYFTRILGAPWRKFDIILP